MIPRDPRFTGSNPAEVEGFFQDVIILSKSPQGGTLSRGSSLKKYASEKKFNRRIHVLVIPQFLPSWLMRR